MAAQFDCSPADTLLRIADGETADQFIGYVTTVFRETLDATWQALRDGPQLLIEGPDGSVELALITLVSAAFSGYVSFAAVYESVADETGLAA